ncbi:hypothetical protein HOY82DRAFT_543370 [Tuber indicum]|nr:hypothetical protein HOY82DRAFT_543370 [Tuber indicum]
MSGEGNESIPPFLGEEASILPRKHASQPASPRGKSTGGAAKDVLASATCEPHLQNDGFQKVASTSEQHHGINQPFRADSQRPGELRAHAEGPVEILADGLSTPKPSLSVRSMPVVSVEQDCLDIYSLGEYIPSPYTSYTAPQKTGQLSLPRSPLTTVADSDPKLLSRQSVLGTPVRSQNENSLAAPESGTSSLPIPLRRDHCASSDDEGASTSAGSDEVPILDFEGMSEAEEDGRSVKVTKPPNVDPRSITDEGEIGFDETLLTSCGHLPSPKSLDLRLSPNIDMEKDATNGQELSFHRAVGSPGGAVKEAFVEQVEPTFYIKNLKNDSLGRLPRITTLERSSSEHKLPEPVAIQESSPDVCRSRRSETFSSDSSETIRAGVRNVVILPGESDRRYHSNCYRRSHGEMDISFAASIKLQGEGSVFPPQACQRGVTVPEGPSRPPTSPATPTAAASPEVAWVRAASEEFPLPDFSLLRKERGSVVLERKPFPPGRGGSNSQGIHPAPAIKTTVLCYTNVLPEQHRASTPVLPAGDDDTGQPDSPSDSLEFSSVRYSRVSVASPMLHARGYAGGSECSKSLRSVKALLLNEGIQLKEDDTSSTNNAPWDRLSREPRSLRTVRS